MKIVTYTLLMLYVVTTFLCPFAAASEFVPLGFLDSSDQVSVADAVDATGQTVVGQANLNGKSSAFIWQRGSGIAPLQVSNDSVIANAITPDGNTIVGRVRTSASPNGGESFLTNATQGYKFIGSLAATSVGSSAQGVSADGQVVVGWSPTDTNVYEAYRWTQQTGFQPLGSLPSGQDYSVADAISPDGSTIVGETGSADGTQAFRWSQGSGMVGIGDLPGGDFGSTALGVSDNGNVIVGVGTSATQQQEAFRWSSASGMVGLGHLPNTSPVSLALSVTPDGTAIVGVSGDADATAFVWDEFHGMRSLQDLLGADPHLVGDLTGWHLLSAQAISSDGRAIVGQAWNPEGHVEGFLVLLDAPLGVPEPNSLAIVTALCAICACSKRQRFI